MPRHSFAVVWNRADNQTYEATVDLTGDSVLSFEHIPDVTPNFTLDEYHDVDQALHEHPEVLARSRRGHNRLTWCSSTSGPTARR